MGLRKLDHSTQVMPLPPGAIGRMFGSMANPATKDLVVQQNLLLC